jgi:hypothetical protein
MIVLRRKIFTLPIAAAGRSGSGFLNFTRSHPVLTNAAVIGGSIGLAAYGVGKAASKLTKYDSLDEA